MVPTNRARRRPTLTFLSLCVWALSLIPKNVPAQEDLPKEFERIIPRGRIAAISSPTFVPARKASIGDDAPVLGVIIDGQARAFSLNLLNYHEVVNDQIDDTAYAAVW